MLPRLRAMLRAGPWRAVCLMAGSNDIILEGASAETALARVAALHAACDEAGVPVRARQRRRPHARTND